MRTFDGGASHPLASSATEIDSIIELMLFSEYKNVVAWVHTEFAYFFTDKQRNSYLHKLIESSSQDTLKKRL
jgi:hypothetical protein